MKSITSAHYFRVQDSLCEAQNSLKDSVIANDKKVYEDLSLVLKNKNEIVYLKNYEIEKLNTQIKQDTKSIRRQKFYKWVAIIAGSTLSGYLALRTVFH